MSGPVRWSLVPVVSAGGDEVVTPAAMRSVLRLDPDDYSQDGQVAICIAGARRLIEGKYRVALVQRSFDLVADGAPGGPVWRLPVGPLISVTSFTYYDVDDASATLVEGTDFELDTVGLPGRLMLKQGKSWPSNLRPAKAIVVRLVAGWDRDALPEVFVPAVQQATAFLFEHRGEGGQEFQLPAVIDELLSDYFRPEA